MNKLYSKLRYYGRYVILSTVGQFRKPSPGIHILNGHMITRNAGSGTLKDRERFRNLLTQLKKTCEFVNFEVAVDMIINQVKVSKPVVAFSFDDGFADCYTHIAPVLEEFGVNAMFFINPNFASAGQIGDEQYIRNFTDNTTLSPGKRPMTWDQIRDLQKRGFLFGAHTFDHSKISECDEQKLKHQIAECRQAIEHELNTPCDMFAWPYGRLTDANSKAVELACSCYRYVFSQSDYKHYFSFDGKVINRRHFEAWWPISHVNYFLSHTKQ